MFYRSFRTILLSFFKNDSYHSLGFESDRIESNSDLNRIESNQIEFESDRIESDRIKFEFGSDLFDPFNFESNRIILKSDPIRSVRNPSSNWAVH